jgi:Protein of unknown function (DUF3987)
MSPEQPELVDDLRASVTHAARPGDPSTNGTQPADSWPAPLGKAAYHGVTGDIVRAIKPETEADPAAVLVQFLVAFGAACGRGAGFRVEADRHGVNEFVVVCGESSIARKGSALGQAIAPISLVDPTLKITTGLSSGEGLIFEIRDPVEHRRKAKKDEPGDDDGYVTEVTDEGVPDKRLLLTETEFASVLSRMGREGNTLSPVIRQGWDGQTLRTMTKASPTKASDPHVAIIAHIVADELRQKLHQTDLLSGFANRFLWVCARRRQSLPRGGKPVEWPGSDAAKDLLTALRFAGSLPGMVDFDDDSGALWDDEYEHLCAARFGLVAAVTNRAPAHVRRLATLYAILDATGTIELEHLQAALEVWRYCEDSCRYLFGQTTGDSLADRILVALRAAPAGLTRTQIREIIGGRETEQRVESALGLLARYRLAAMSVETETGGRPAERWQATTTEKEPA